MHLLRVVTTEGLIRFCTPTDLPSIDPNQPSLEDADAHWMVTDTHDQVRARCSLWWHATPDLNGERVGFIGHYAAHDRHRDDRAAAQALLSHVCRELADHHCTLAIGPLDGNTFRAYRFVTQRSFEGRDRPPYFLEPDNPPAWPQHFVANGFGELAHYYSAYTALAAADPRRAQLERQNRQVRIRPIDLADFTCEISHIYDIVCQSFQKNLLYQSIGRAEFMAIYAPIQPYIQPELVWIAEQENRPLGFIFALPDLAQRARGEAIDTVILKTVAVVPEASRSGLGSLLVATCQDTARSLGFRTAIHALMHEDNISRKISHHYATLMRKYTLFARPIGLTHA